MPKINPYDSPQREQNPVLEEGLGSLRNAGVSAGGALKQFGGDVTQAGDRAYQRQAQAETSEINAGFAEASYDLQEEINQGVQDGTIDSEKIGEAVQKRINDLGENVGTEYSRRTYERGSARLKSQMMKQAIKGQAAVAGARAVNNAKTEMTAYGAGLRSDPSLYGTNVQAMQDSINDMVATRGLKEVDAAKLRVEASKDLTKNAIIGWAKLSPELAEKRLNEAEYNKNLDDASYKEMQNYINAQKSAKLTEAKRQEAAIKKAEKMQTDIWVNQNLDGLVKGEVSVDKVMDAPMPWKMKLQLVDKINKQAEGGGVTNPRITNDIRRRILLPDGHRDKVVDIQQIVDIPGVQLDGIEAANKLLAISPEAKAMQKGEADLFEMVKKSLGAKDASSPFLKTDEYAEYNIDRFMNDYQQAKRDAIAKGGNLRDLVNPNSKDYFGFKVNQYKLTPEQTLKKQAEIQRAQFDASQSLKAPKAPEQKRIRVKAPGGQTGTILESEKSYYLQKGYQLLGN